MRRVDHLKKPLRAILAPFLVGHGFVRYKTRGFVRRRADIVHYLDLQPDRYEDSFVVNFAAMSLYPPATSISLDVGDRLYSTGMSWWRADSEAVVEESLTEVIRRYDSTIGELWRKTGGPAEFMEVLRAGRMNAHARFALAACQARLGDPWALRNTATAIGAYQTWLEAIPTATWCRDFIELAEALADALLQHNEQELLDRWVNHSVSAINLPNGA